MMTASRPGALEALRGEHPEVTRMQPQRTTLPRDCAQCGTSFIARVRRDHPTWGTWCNDVCSRLARRSRVERDCERCGRTFSITASRAQSGRGRFCSIDCRPRPIDERFWEKVNKDGPIPEHVPDLGPCWVWLRGRDEWGYGTFDLNGQTVKAHRLAWELATSPIPGGLHVLHHCDNPPCVRPSHLFIGTIADNNRDCEAKGRRVYLVGESHPLAILTESLVNEIRRERKNTGLSLKALASKYGVSFHTIYDVVKHRRWTHVSDDGGR